MTTATEVQPAFKPSRVAFTAEEARLLAPYVTQVGHSVFCLRNLPEEVVAVLFAYYSRSRDGLQTNLLRLLNDHALDVADEHVRSDLKFAQEKAKAFHEKWVVGYGHASVAEHAVAHVALEQVSIVASKVIEDTRLAAFTEKSTRYVLFDQDSFVLLHDALPRDLAKLYHDTASNLLSTYVSLYEPLVSRIKERVPRKEGQAERAYEASVRAQACDVLRYLLPCGTRTHIGMTANGRVLEQLIKKMLGHPLREMKVLGKKMHEECSVIIPTLLKYVDPSAHRTEVDQRLAPYISSTQEQSASKRPVQQEPGSEVAIVDYDADALDRIVAAIGFERRNTTLVEAKAAVSALAHETKVQIWNAYVSDRGKFDAPLRALEHASITVDIVLDQGAFRDLQRHRMQSQTVPLLGFDNGYALHDASEALGVADMLRSAIEAAQPVWETIVKDFPYEAQYVVPLAACRRYMVTMNLREAFHFIELRSGRQGHVSYRRVAQQLYRAIAQIYPWAADVIRVDAEDYSLARP